MPLYMLLLLDYPLQIYVSMSLPSTMCCCLAFATIPTLCESKSLNWTDGLSASDNPGVMVMAGDYKGF